MKVWPLSYILRYFLCLMSILPFMLFRIRGIEVWDCYSKISDVASSFIGDYFECEIETIDWRILLSAREKELVTFRPACIVLVAAIFLCLKLSLTLSIR